MRRVSKTQLGGMLIEFQIAMVLSAISITSLLSFHTALFSNNYEDQQRHQVHDAAEKVLTIMQRELMRAGFMQRLSVAEPNVFVYNSDKLFQTNSAQNCISYRYDRNKNGLLDGEYFGFRLHNNAIQVSKGQAQDCSYTSGWESISDANTVTIINLQFSLDRSARTPSNHTQTYLIITMDIASKLSPKLQFNFKRNVLTQVAL